MFGKAGRLRGKGIHNRSRGLVTEANWSLIMERVHCKIIRGKLFDLPKNDPFIEGFVVLLFRKSVAH